MEEDEWLRSPASLRCSSRVLKETPHKQLTWEGKKNSCAVLGSEALCRMCLGLLPDERQISGRKSRRQEESSHSVSSARSGVAVGGKVLCGGDSCRHGVWLKRTPPFLIFIPFPNPLPPLLSHFALACHLNPLQFCWS